MHKIVVENRPTQDHFSKVSIHNFSGLKICKKRVYRNYKKNLPWDFWKVSWIGLFLTTQEDINVVVISSISSTKAGLSFLKC